jgi:hypothetical protein
LIIDDCMLALIVGYQSSIINFFMETKGLLLKSAMFYGLLLGIFWIVKYVFLILGVTYPNAGLVYWILTTLTIVFAYVFTKVYKILMGGRISFSRAWQFGVLLYFFAALIVSLLHYVFYRYLSPPEYIAGLTDAAVRMMKEINPQAEEALSRMPALTPARLTLQGIFVNVFYGSILSVPVAALLCRKRITGIVYLGGNQDSRETPDNREQNK